MLRKLLLVLVITLLSACSLKSYIPFIDHKKPVINLDKEQIDQKSYAAAYEAIIQTYKGRVTNDFYVDSFVSGVNDWYLNRILVPVADIKSNLYQGGHDSNIYAYYSGVIFAYELQENFSKLKPDCWSKIDKPSVTQGINDAMFGLQKDKPRDEDDEYLVKGSEQILNICTK
ncbi:hypothetical protein EV697_10479 [Bisgaardia hudsonensis]|uniref:Lipoprotein n=1 Tax=Bisgaardia hudsonensis TaxID=109472 RepID=A0A4R2MZZ6_9PAST|nr:hypothetical protein [Bisgaardia hudsonensis]QLB12230.1 hypothetical protein A6A11_00660 [Bisgaardia hudsonensis]TCP12273.1 hypothetical protein EV697_10479 [Bisgaardia hudsonensis]